jgi:hypothetical protein
VKFHLIVVASKVDNGRYFLASTEQKVCAEAVGVLLE